jgi:hypothetical protein
MATVEESVEVWKQIEGFEKYEVSTKGNVRNIKTQKLLRTILNKSSYSIVQLLGNTSKGNKVYIHRLVCAAFIPNSSNPETKSHINHKDGNNRNNNVENLEWINNVKCNKCRTFRM